MYGIEVSVILFACIVTVVGLLTAPFWTRALGRIASRLWRQTERSGAAIDKLLGIHSDSSVKDLLDSSSTATDTIPEEEK
jgi:hypothetical protein